MKRPIALAAGAAALLGLVAPAAAEPRRAPCGITLDGEVAFSGPCLFAASESGTFHLRPAQGRVLVGDTTDITVWVDSPGVADVRGLTVHGINSRWGAARRSRRDRACWEGSDFSICAY